MRTRPYLALFIAAIFSTAALAAGDREAKVAADKKQFDAQDDWLYNKLDEAYAQARSTGKPIMAVLRCIPCEECVKLDDDLIEKDPIIASLMDKFIRLRLTGTNGLDLKTFQYDTDQSFAIFFLNADKVVYGRFGTRSHRTEWVTDVSVEGMAEAMKGALALHSRYPANRGELVGKSNQPTEYATPEKYPTLNKKPGRLNWEGKDFAKGVVKNCIHCHEISEARMEIFLQKRERIPETVLYPYPHPKSIGLVLDPKHRARVAEVRDGSAAQRAGLQSGDDVLRMNGQPLISMADVQWVLHHVPAEGQQVELLVRRGGQISKLSLQLEPGWRRQDDTSWRTGHWMLRRSMLGGMKLSRAKSDDSGASKLKVDHVGNWGPFGVAKRAGVRQNDIIVAVDGRTDLQRESDVFDYINENKRSGDQIELVLLRGSAEQTVRYKFQ